MMQYKQFEKVVSKMKGFKGGCAGVSQLQNMLPPHLLKQMGGASGLQNMMRSLGGGGGLGALGNMFGGK